MKRTVLLLVLLSLGLNYGCSSDKKGQDVGSEVQREESSPSTSPTGVESDTSDVEMEEGTEGYQTDDQMMEDESKKDQHMEDSDLEENEDAM